MLEEELKKLNPDQLDQIIEVWNIDKKASDKAYKIKVLLKYLLKKYYIKGVLEKLTSLQVSIFSIILDSNKILTLGEIANKIHLASVNVEQELAVLKSLMLVYQRKNRERLTSNSDKYFPMPEIQKFISTKKMDFKNHLEISIRRSIVLGPTNEISDEYKQFFPENATVKEIAKYSVEDETFKKLLSSLTIKELNLVDEVFVYGGVLEVSPLRILLDDKKLNPEKTISKLNDLFLLRDIQYIDERFVRIVVIPIELFEYLKKNPIFLKSQGLVERQEKLANNEFDFIINLQRTLLFISKKGITVIQDGKIKRSDLKKSRTFFLETDVSLFLEKSHITTIEIALPVLKLLNLVSLKDNYIVLEKEYSEFFQLPPIHILNNILSAIQELNEQKQKSYDRVFQADDIPFFKDEFMEIILEMLMTKKDVYIKVILAELIRELVLLKSDFRIKNLQSLYLENRSEIVSVLFYLQIFGLITVDYPKRKVNLSLLGKDIYYGEDIELEDQPGSIIINTDHTILAFKDNMSLQGLYKLKVYTELKKTDQVYVFQITKERLQEAVLMGYNIEEFLVFLKDVSKNEIPESVRYSIIDWTEYIPIVTIEENIVLVEISEPKLMEELIGQIKNEKVIYKTLSDSAIAVYADKIPKLIEVSEKLEFIIQLIR